MAFVRIFFDVPLKDHFHLRHFSRKEQSKKKMNDPSLMKVVYILAYYNTDLIYRP